MALATRTKCYYFSLIIHNYLSITTQIQHITCHHQTFSTKNQRELEYQQQNGDNLNHHQLHKISRKQELKAQIQQIRNGTFKLHETHSQTQTESQLKQNNNKLAKNIPNKRPPKSDDKYYKKAHSLNRYQINTIMSDDSDALDLNEKIEKLLSRPNYSIWAVRELFASFNNNEWSQIPTQHIRHILDTYYIRNDIIFVYKILMKWFPKKMGNKYILYSDLCAAATERNNLQIAMEVFEYLLNSLQTQTNKYNDNDVSLLLYHIYHNMNLLIPIIISQGQFYLFDELVLKLINLKDYGLEINGIFSNANLALLWKSCVENESIKRLLIIIEWINENGEKQNIVHFLNILDHKYIMKALVLAINANNTALFMEIMTLCDNCIAIERQFGDIIIYCIENNLLHCVLSEDTNCNLSGVVHVNNVQLNDMTYFETIIEDYARQTNNKLGIASWNIICDWLLQSLSIGSVNVDIEGMKGMQIINDLIYYFGGIQCFDSLVMDNIGDAMRWMQLIHNLLCDDQVKRYINGVQSLHTEQYNEYMNGIICALQLTAYLRMFDMLTKIINNLPLELMEIYCVDIIDCIVCENVNLLQLNENKDGIFKYNGSEGDDSIGIIRRAFQIIELLDEINAVGIVNKGWRNGENKFRTNLQNILENIDKNHIKETQITQLNDVNGPQNRTNNVFTDRNRKDNDLKWFDALSDFAFNQK